MTSGYQIARLLVPPIFGFVIWLYGGWQTSAEGHGAGYSAFVRYLAVFGTGLMYLILFHRDIDRVFAGFSEITMFAWFAAVWWVGHKRHLQ